MNKIDNLQKEGLPESLNEECETEIEKIKSLKNLKNLIKNYKYVVESQDKLLNKAITKQNDFKPVILQNQQELDYNASNYNKILDDKEIEKARQFLAEQKNYLEDKHKELDMTKKMMNATMKKLDEDKQQILQKR